MIALLGLGIGACTGGQVHSTLHAYDDRPTEVDTTYNSLTSATRYQPPRHVRQYRYDQTEVDLARPLESSTQH